MPFVSRNYRPRVPNDPERRAEICRYVASVFNRLDGNYVEAGRYLDICPKLVRKLIHEVDVPRVPSPRGRPKGRRSTPDKMRVRRIVPQAVCYHERCDDGWTFRVYSRRYGDDRVLMAEHPGSAQSAWRIALEGLQTEMLGAA